MVEGVRFFLMQSLWGLESCQHTIGWAVDVSEEYKQNKSDQNKSMFSRKGWKKVAYIKDKTLQGVNFTNILRAAFSCKHVFRSVLSLKIMFVIFGRKEIGKKLIVKWWWNWLQEPNFVYARFPFISVKIGLTT